MPDHELVEPADRTIEAKLWASAAGTLVVSLLAGLHTLIQDQPELLFGLPPGVQFVLVTLLPPLVAFGAGWVKRSNRV